MNSTGWAARMWVFASGEAKTHEQVSSSNDHQNPGIDRKMRLRLLLEVV
jgi:hypothetical protein